MKVRTENRIYNWSFHSASKEYINSITSNGTLIKQHKFWSKSYYGRNCAILYILKTINL